MRQIDWLSKKVRVTDKQSGKETDTEKRKTARRGSTYTYRQRDAQKDRQRDAQKDRKNIKKERKRRRQVERQIHAKTDAHTSFDNYRTVIYRSFENYFLYFTVCF